jgi:hypothetical protein
VSPSPEGLEFIAIAVATAKDQIATDLERKMLRGFDHMGDPSGIAYVETVERAIRIVRGLE